MIKCFFYSSRWALWSWGGLVVIVSLLALGTWFNLQINIWFGEFYNLIQMALSKDKTVVPWQLYVSLFGFLKIAMPSIISLVFVDFFSKHWCFRWRKAMNDYYLSHWPLLRNVEGASQRIQEDIRLFGFLMETLGSSFVKAIFLLIAFLPLLFTLSKSIVSVPFFGAVSHSLVYVAIVWAALGTAVLFVIGLKLPGLEFNNQRVEAAYRKELVYGEDHQDHVTSDKMESFFADLKKNYFRLFFHYFYFDLVRWSYLQFSVVIPYVFLIPTIVSKALTLGLLQQIVRAFGQVESSFQFLINSWPSLVQLISVYKRLALFQKCIEDPSKAKEFELPSHH